MKKIILPVLVCLLVLTGCGIPSAALNKSDAADDDQVLLTFEGADVPQLTREEFLALEQMTVSLRRTNSRGKTTTGIYSGVHWLVLAEAIGAQDAKSVRVIASDGYEQAYSLDVLQASDSLFALYKDGKPITEEDHNGKIWFCASENYTANFWAKFIVKIVVQ